MAAAGCLVETNADPSQGALPASSSDAGARQVAANADILTADDAAHVAEPAPDASSIDRATIEAALARILASATFRHSKRHRDFVAYVVRAALDGHRQSLKEVVIGLEVFARSLNGYDPHRDTIVRVEAGRLRTKLQRYYDGEGAAEPLEIRLPVGTYAPVFLPRVGLSSRAPMRSAVTVLPFSTVRDEPQLKSFATALADLLMDRLAKGAGLTIVAPSAAAKSRRDAHRIEPGVGCVVDGAILRHGTRLRCIAHLSASRRGPRMWLDVFDFDAAAEGSDLFAFQDVIVEAICTAVCSRKEAADVVRP